MSFYAFKGFDKDLKCRGFQYEVGKTYSMPEKPEICERGYHCCTALSEVFNYYPPSTNYYPPSTWITAGYPDYVLPVKRLPTGNRYCMVEVCGDIDTDGASFANSSKVATNSITILEELTDDAIINILEQEALEAKNTQRRIDRSIDEFIAYVQQKRGDNRPWHRMTRFL